MNIDIEKLQKVMDEATESGEECGCQLAIYQDGKLAVSLFSGYTSAERNEKVTERTLFPVFSCGKSVMSTLMHMLKEEGKLDYNARIADYWPEFGCRGKEDIRVWQVMSHRTGLHELPKIYSFDCQGDWEYMCRKMEQSAPKVTPGTKCNYQGVTYAWLAGETVRRAAGQGMQQLIRDRILRRLGIDDSFVFGTTAVQDRLCASVDSTQKPGSWCAQVFQSLPIRHGFVPSMNACGNALSLARYYSALVTKTDGVRLLKKSTLDHATELCRDADDPIPPEGTWTKFGLGYALLEKGGTLGIRFGHGGALGSEGFADRESTFAFAFTKNKDLPSHPVHPLRNHISAVLGLPERIW